MVHDYSLEKPMMPSRDSLTSAKFHSFIAKRLTEKLSSQSLSVNAAQRQFFLTYNSYISGSDDKVVDNTSPEACASSCRSEASFICRSFEFDNSTNRCAMSSKSSYNTGLASASNYRFFELSKCTSLAALIYSL